MSATTLVVNDLTAGTTLTNSTAETVLKSHTFPADWFQLGVGHGFTATVRVPSTNSTDTLTLRARLGGTTLTGTVIAVTAAIDVADDDTAVISGSFTFDTIGTAGAGEASSSTVGPDAAGIATGSGQSTALASLDTTAALLLEITGEWSVASASNQCAAQKLQISILPG